MSIWNKILIGFVFIASVVFFYMAARTLKTHQHWRELAQRHEARIQALEKDSVELVEADGTDPDGMLGIRRIRLESHRLTIDRGRVWYNCTPEAPDPQTAKVAVATDQPSPHGITARTILQVFEEKEIDQNDLAQSGRYLGDFRVTAVAEGEVQLEPTRKMLPEELQRVAASTGSWALYEIMPVDHHDIFPDLDETELAVLLPQAVLSEYVNDGEEATENELQQWGIVGTIEEDGRYVRRLRDYEVSFKEFHLQRSIMIDRIASATQDRDDMIAARDDADRQRIFAEEQKTHFQAKLAENVRQRDIVLAHVRALGQEVAQRQTAISRMIVEIKAKAAQITQIQISAAKRVEQRTGSMARNAAGGQ